MLALLATDNPRKADIYMATIWIAGVLLVMNDRASFDILRTGLFLGGVVQVGIWCLRCLGLLLRSVIQPTTLTRQGRRKIWRPKPTRSWLAVPALFLAGLAVVKYDLVVYSRLRVSEPALMNHMEKLGPELKERPDSANQPSVHIGLFRIYGVSRSRGMTSFRISRSGSTLIHCAGEHLFDFKHKYIRTQHLYGRWWHRESTVPGYCPGPEIENP